MKGDNFVSNVLWFIGGTFVCYFLVQFQYFDIDYKLNIPTILLGVGTAVIYLYIAQTITRSHNQRQNRYSFLIPKIDSSWQDFIAFSTQLNNADNLKVGDLALGMKTTLRNASYLNSVFKPFGLTNEHLLKIETVIDEIDHKIFSCPVSENIVNYSAIKTDLIKMNDNINKCFSDIIISVNG